MSTNYPILWEYKEMSMSYLISMVVIMFLVALLQKMFSEYFKEKAVASKENRKKRWSLFAGMVLTVTAGFLVAAHQIDFWYYFPLLIEHEMFLALFVITPAVMLLAIVLSKGLKMLEQKDVSGQKRKGIGYIVLSAFGYIVLFAIIVIVFSP